MVDIHIATPEDAKAIASMLRALAEDIGDANRFCTDESAIRRFGFGVAPLFHCMIAKRQGEYLGLVLYFPGFSTTMAIPGLYVQDLWVSSAARGSKLGKHLLAAAAKHAAKAWGAGYLALTVYQDNPRAQVFYERLGFELHPSENPMRLTGARFKGLFL